jgi:hypothetical protein
MAEMADEAVMQMLLQQAGEAGSAKKVHAQFSMETEQDMEESEKQKRPVFKDVEYITLWVDKDNVPHRPVRQLDKAMYPDAYKAFKANQEQPVVGTPLDRLGFLGKSQIAELNYYGVRTAEQVVDMADVNGQKIMGFQAIKQKAKAYIDAVNGAAPAQKLQAELSKRDEEIEHLKQLVAEQTKKMEVLAGRKG